MEQINRYAPIAVVVVIAAFLQVLLVSADGPNMPHKVAAEFTKAYYRLDPVMAEYLCEANISGENSDAVEKYIQRAKLEAKQRGFDLNYLKNMLYSLGTHTHLIDDNTAEVQLHAKRRIAINPVYAHIAKFFFIGESYKVDKKLHLVKEKGQWKVCGRVL